MKSSRSPDRIRSISTSSLVSVSAPGVYVRCAISGVATAIGAALTGLGGGTDIGVNPISSGAPPLTLSVFANSSTIVLNRVPGDQQKAYRTLIQDARLF